MKTGTRGNFRNVASKVDARKNSTISGSAKDSLHGKNSVGSEHVTGATSKGTLGGLPSRK